MHFKSIILFPEGLVGLYLSHKTWLWTQKLKFWMWKIITWEEIMRHTKQRKPSPIIVVLQVSSKKKK